MLYFLIPVYNEVDNLELLAKNLGNFQTDQKKYFVFVDDCSTDDSVEDLKKHFSSFDLKIITKKENGGPGDSFNKGFEWILSQNPKDSDRIVTLEADNTSDLAILNNMLVISNLNYDLVLASVYAQGGGFVNTSLFRKVLSIVANLFIRNVLNIKVLTMSSFYRVYSPELLKRIKEQYPVIIEEKGFISMVEVLYKAINAQAKIIEVPMELNSLNRKGNSKMKIFSTGMSYLKYLIKRK